MSNTEQKLKERIKELTCLYEVSSIISNTNTELIEDTVFAIATSLKKAFQFPEKISITIHCKDISVSTGTAIKNKPFIQSNISVFNEVIGQILAQATTLELKQHHFLAEEQLLLNNVAIKVSNLLERIEIQKNETLLKRQMERADRLGILGELTAGIAHELNTPLANILGFAELMKDNFKNDKNASKDIDKIIQNAIFSREVVKKLMFFACEMPQEMKKINIVPNIKNAIALLEASFRKKEVKYLVKIEDEELWLRADTIQLTQIIFNLIINAIYFSPKNGLVTIEAFQDKKQMVLKISDEGIGLSDEALEKIFQPFFTTKPIGEGSGLGLSVVHGIVASHHGSITAQNNKEKGTTFVVKLPKS